MRGKLAIVAVLPLLVLVWGSSLWAQSQPAAQRQLLAPDVLSLSPTDDSFINSMSPEGTGGGEEIIRLAVNNAAFGTARVLIHFDLSKLPPGATVQSATLVLRARVRVGPAFMSQPVTAYNITSAWTENEASWVTMASAFDQPWGEVRLLGASFGIYRMEVTGLVQKWMAGELPNYGMMLQANEGSTVDIQLEVYAKEKSPGEGPILELTYTAPPTPTPSPIATPSPTATGVATPTHTPTPTPTPTATSTPTPTPTPAPKPLYLPAIFKQKVRR